MERGERVEKKYLKKFYEEKIKVKLNLKNGKFYTGEIIELGKNVLVFLDKFKTKIPFDYDSLSYVEPVNFNRGYNG